MNSLSALRCSIKGSSGTIRVSPPYGYASARRYTSTMHDNDPEVLEREKRRNLTGNQHKTSTPIDDAPGWNEDLATASEAHVKADRSSVTINDLQRKTVNYIHARHQPEELMEHREAAYLRDEVSGPLGSARVGEFEGVVGAGDLGIDHEGTDIDSDGRTIKRHVIHEETSEVLRKPNPTPSEADVKADRGEYS